MDLWILLFWTFVLLNGPSRSPVDKPANVVFILVDDLGYHDLSSTGSTYYETPNVDRIAREGTVFRQGYACGQVSR